VQQGNVSCHDKTAFNGIIGRAVLFIFFYPC
jgi:hypothetical protein